MNHAVDLAAVPKAAAPLAALYVATRTAAVAGATARKHRLKLARAIAATNAELADILRGTALVRVKPLGGNLWTVDDMTEQTADAKLAKVLADEVKHRGITQRELAAKAKVGQQAVSRVLKNDRDPRWTTVVGILDALGRDLTWLDRQLKRTPEPPTG